MTPIRLEKKGLLQQMAERYGLDPTVFERTVAATAMPQKNGAPDCTREELISCLLVAHEHNLNPLTKEIYFMRTKGGPIMPIVGVDGWMRKLNEHPQFDGLEFEDHLGPDGELISITCVVYRKDRAHPIKVTEYLDECKAAGGPAWKTSPKRMLRHRTLTQGARYAVGFAGVMDRDEFDQWQVVRDVTPAAGKEVVKPGVNKALPPVVGEDAQDEWQEPVDMVPDIPVIHEQT
jgi:hypothetical protein